VWGKIIGAVAGFAMGGPLGAMAGVAVGHAAETGSFRQLRFGLPGGGRLDGPALAARLASREQTFAIAAVVLSAKLAKCDGPVNRAEIEAFKQNFQVPPQAAQHIGRLFDRSRDSADGFEPYARQLGRSFADNPSALEGMLRALFAIARADQPLTNGELAYLRRVHVAFGLDAAAWERASGERAQEGEGEDPYGVLGLEHGASDAEVRACWRRLARELHPDGMAGRGAGPEMIARASDRLARVNAAWDRIKRERRL
jgi:DnaJ like chaperone protein